MHASIELGSRSLLLGARAVLVPSSTGRENELTCSCLALVQTLQPAILRMYGVHHVSMWKDHVRDNSRG